ncbi:MAG: Xaa-Pro peptidase family protein [Spirochaetales bacterium]|nr:Xaa-Pro peptidase family protein [Spirochaetales bacterium]
MADKMISAAESRQRIEAFRNIMDRENPDWEMALILGKINQFYLTGTMQDGFLCVEREGKAVLWVRRSVERAKDESPLENIEAMGSYRQASGHYKSLPKRLYLDKEIVSLSVMERLQKAFAFESWGGVDRQLLKIRSVKSSREREIMTRSGRLHKELFEQRIPPLLREGMDEREFTIRVFQEMMDLGYHGVSRFNMFQTEMMAGQIGFGENSCYPSYFNGPGGNKGQHAAVPLWGETNRKLAKGDMVFTDIAFGVDGYHTDQTMTYLFKGELPSQARTYHDYCVELRDKAAARLKPGEIPSLLYADILEEIAAHAPAGFAECFMGHPGNQVKFLGHGVGLHIDEYPVIAKGFDEPLEENMIIALEPKCAIPGVGTVGVEDTFAVGAGGGECLTGGGTGMIKL